MDPVTVTALAKTVGEKLFELAKSVKDRDIKQRIDGIIDELRELKHSASKLEDENRELRENLRFKSEEFDFRNPFWYHKAHTDRPLCPKCFAKNVAAPMDEPGHTGNSEYRTCLACGSALRVVPRSRRQSPTY